MTTRLETTEGTRPDRWVGSRPTHNDPDDWDRPDPGALKDDLFDEFADDFEEALRAELVRGGILDDE